MFKKDYIWNSVTCSCKNGKSLGSIADYFIITCDEIIDTTKVAPKTFNEKRQPVKEKNSIFYSLFYSLPLHYL